MIVQRNAATDMAGFMAQTMSTVAQPGLSEFDKAAEAFRTEAKKSPLDRIRDEVLKSHNLTEDTFNALPPDQHDAIQKEIVQALKEKLKLGEPGADPTGLSANVVA